MSQGATSYALECYYRDIGGNPPLTIREECALFSRLRRGDMAARDRLVKANLRFVITVAKEYPNSRIPIEERISAGNLGLLDAIDRFDETRGLRFITYAVWWIRHHIQALFAEQYYTIRLPANRMSLLGKINRFLAEQGETGHSVSVNDIAKNLEVSPDHVKEILGSPKRCASLDASLDAGNDLCLMDRIEGNSLEALEKEIAYIGFAGHLKEALASLKEIERFVILKYFGLDGSEGMSLAEIGEELNLSKERIRQIREGALQRLRHPKRARCLIEYVDAG